MHAIRPLMEYKGIEYAVRARPGPHQWVWTILPKGVAAFMSHFVGTKEGSLAGAAKGEGLIRRLADAHAFGAPVSLGRPR
jgi:hypothetical protein